MSLMLYLSFGSHMTNLVPILTIRRGRLGSGKIQADTLYLAALPVPEEPPLPFQITQPLQRLQIHRGIA